MTEPSPKPLNGFEVWVSEHAVKIFAVIALLIVLFAGAVFLTYEKSGNAEHEVDFLRPQVTRVSSASCDRRSLKVDARALRCAERIRIGLTNCRRVQRCRAAYLALATFPLMAATSSSTSSAEKPSGTAATTRAPSSEPGGGALQSPSSNGHQQRGATPAPTEATHEPPSAVSPSPAPAPSQDQTPESPAEMPSVTPSPPPTPPKVSAPTVEVCVLEHTCVGVHTGLGALLEGEG